MLHKTVVLANLQVLCPTKGTELFKIANQLRHLFYAASLPWSEGNLGRVIPILNFEDFYGEYEKLRNAFDGVRGATQTRKKGFDVTLTILPFPALTLAPVKDSVKAPYIISKALEERFDRRIRMLSESIQEEKRFYESLLSELEKIIETGIYLKKTITPQLLGRLKFAESSILIHTAGDIRQSVSLRGDIINRCNDIINVPHRSP